MPNDLSKLNLGDGNGDRNLKDKALQDGLIADMDYTGFDGPANVTPTPLDKQVWMYDATNRIWKPVYVSASYATYDNSDSSLDATNVKAAIDEIDGKAYYTNDSASTTVNNTDYVPMSTSDGTRKKSTWSNLLDKIKAAVTGATVKTRVAKTGSGTTVTSSISASTTMDSAVGTLLNNDVALKSLVDGKLNKSGGTMTGALNFANNTWNNVGDDVAIGDHDVAGMFCIKGLNSNPGIGLYNSNESANARIYYNGTDIQVYRSNTGTTVGLFNDFFVVQNDTFNITVGANGTISSTKSYSKSGYTPIFCILTSGAWSDNCMALHQSWSKASGSASVSFIMISKYGASMTVTFDIQILWKKN